MITYSFNKNDIKKITKELSLFLTKKFLIASAVILPFAIVYLCVGEGETVLYFGLPLLLMVLLFLTASVIVWIKTKEGVKNQFRNCTEDGTVEYTLDRTNNVFTVKSANTDKEIKFRVLDIAKIATTKSLLVVKMKNGFVVEFPKETATRLFSDLM